MDRQPTSSARSRTPETLARDVAALAERFAGLGTKLGEAARELESAGAPPSDGLVEDLGAARTQFTELSAEVLRLADATGVRVPAGAESLAALAPVIEATRQEQAARARREEFQAHRQQMLGVLDRVLKLGHRDDAGNQAVAECHKRARDLRQVVGALAEGDLERLKALASDLTPFSNVLLMIDSRDALDDERYVELEDAVSRTFGRALAVAATRGRLQAGGSASTPVRTAAAGASPAATPAAPATPARPAAAVREPARPAPASSPAPAAPLSSPPAMLPQRDAVAFGRTDAEPAAPRAVAAAAQTPAKPAAPAKAAPPPAAAASAADHREPAGPDETAQWWLAAWARWSGWKNSLDYGEAIREEIGKYPYLLSVPIQQSPEYEDGLVAYGYSILMEHVERQKPGCIGNALANLKTGTARPVGDQLYDYLVTEGRLTETYPEFVQAVLAGVLPDPGLWFQARVLESKDETRIIRREGPRIGDTEQQAQRLTADGQRFGEHEFALTLAPLTCRFMVVSGDVKESRGVGVKLAVDGTPSDSAWVVTVPVGAKGGAKLEPRRLLEDGTHAPGLGRDYGALWIAVFNADPAQIRQCQVTVVLRKDNRSPFAGRGKTA
jgi:hypothetical protein